jgi:hypothetical protein
MLIVHLQKAMRFYAFTKLVIIFGYITVDPVILIIQTQ